MNFMTYKGYAARVEFDDEDHLFVRHIFGIRDIVSFHGLMDGAHRTICKYN